MLDRIFGLTPNNIELYKLALVHRSASHYLPDGTAVNNERLEFLGDAVLETIISDFVFIEFPNEDEGFLTQIRSKAVNRLTLNDLCVKIGLSEYICTNGGGSIQKHLNGDALEAMIGAMYLDQGYDRTNRVILRMFADYMSISAMETTVTDFKSHLIEWCQKSKHSIRFLTRHGEGSTSRQPMFRAAVIIDDMEVGHGFGTSKKEAEQQAAYTVYAALDDERGDSILELVDRSLEPCPRCAASTEDGAVPASRRRRRGGRRHRARKSSVEGVESIVAEDVSTANPVAEAAEVVVEETIAAKKPRRRRKSHADAADKDVIVAAEKVDTESPAAHIAEVAKVAEVTVEEAAAAKKPRRRRKPRAETSGTKAVGAENLSAENKPTEALPAEEKKIAPARKPRGHKPRAEMSETKAISTENLKTENKPVEAPPVEEKKITPPARKSRTKKSSTESPVLKEVSMESAAAETASAVKKSPVKKPRTKKVAPKTEVASAEDVSGASASSQPNPQPKRSGAQKSAQKSTQRKTAKPKE